MNINQDKVPETLEEAVADLIAALEPGERDQILQMDDSQAHFGLGMYLRNNWSMWDSDLPLVKHIKARFGIFGHGDDCSGIILHCFWKEVRGEPWEAESVAEGYKEHWRNMKIDPQTGKDLK